MYFNVHIRLWDQVELNKKTIKHVKKGDDRTIVELYKYSFNILMSQVVRYKANEEDRMTLLNNVFLKVINKIDKYTIGTSYKAWISQIMRNEIIDDYRKNKKLKETIEYKEELEEIASHSSIETDIEAEQLAFYLSSLPPASKLVFNLYVIDGYSSKEICEELDITYETFKWHLKEARKKLRTTFHKSEKLLGENL